MNSNIAQVAQFIQIAQIVNTYRQHKYNTDNKVSAKDTDNTGSINKTSQ